MKEKEEFYGILTSWRLLGKGIYYFLPIDIIKGIYEDEFIDEKGKSYLTSNSIDFLDMDEEIIVTNIITKSELLKDSKMENEKEAMNEYFESFSELSYIGFFMESEEKVQIIPFDLKNIYYGLNNELFSIEQIIDANLQYVLKELEQVNRIENCDSQAIPTIGIDALLNCKNMEEVKIVLQNMKRSIIDTETKTDPSSQKAQPTDYSQKQKELETTFSVLPNSEIGEIFFPFNFVEAKKFLDASVIGQEEAKKTVLLSIFKNELSANSRDRIACLLIGPTGSGKTFILSKIGEYLDRIFEVFDSTQLSAPGYVGSNIEDFLARLLSKARGDINKAQNSIVVFDEIDKKGSKNNSDVSGKAVINALLSFLQGTVYTVEYNHQKILFDTSKMTVFATGSFANVVKEKNGQQQTGAYHDTTFGFTASLRKKNNQIEDITYPEITHDDLEKYGQMPREFLGRLSYIVQLKGHTIDSLKNILLFGDESPICFEKRKLNKIGIDIKFMDGYIDELAKQALELKEGARSLKTVFEKSVLQAECELFMNFDKFKTIILLPETVLCNETFILQERNGNYVKFEGSNKSNTESISQLNLDVKLLQKTIKEAK